MSSTDWVMPLGAGIAGLSASALWVWLSIRAGKRRLMRKSSYRGLIERLENYSILAGNGCRTNGLVQSLQEREWCERCRCQEERIEYQNARPLLGPGGHKILLGVLKKIEAKSAVLLSVIIFLSASVIGGKTSIPSEANGLTFFYWLIVGLLLGLLVGGIDGAGHLGQPHYEKHSKKSIKIIRPREMQRWLMLDLVSKEYAFRAMYIGVGFVMAAIVFLSFFAGLVGAGSQLSEPSA